MPPMRNPKTPGGRWATSPAHRSPVTSHRHRHGTVPALSLVEQHRPEFSWWPTPSGIDAPTLPELPLLAAGLREQRRYDRRRRLLAQTFVRLALALAAGLASAVYGPEVAG